MIPLLFRLQLLNWPALAPYLSGVVLLGVLLGVQWGILQPARHELTALRQQLARLPAQTVRPLPLLVNHEDPIASTLAQFPDLRQAPEILSQLDALADKQGMKLEKQSFDWTDEADVALTRLEFGLELKLEEARLQAFLTDAKQTIPTLAITHSSFKREDSRSALMETQLRMVIYFRRPS